MIPARAEDLSTFRNVARSLIALQVAPSLVLWNDADALFGGEPLVVDDNSPEIRLPAEFHPVATLAAMHSRSDRFDLLYRIIWRLLHESRNLMMVEVDDDVRELVLLAKAVKRDIHKMRAFVRFKRLEIDGVEHFIAWHAPEHLIVRHNAEFFKRRFGNMRWTIMTQVESVSWDLKELSFEPGVPQSAAPKDDALEELWLSYYSSIFNPGRVMIDAMKSEMPMKHWKTLPESRLIAPLVTSASSRVVNMKQAQPTSAADFIPDNNELPILRQAASSCKACSLYRNCTQAVFGEGPNDAEIVVVGEQPGDQEDLAGRPFVGPAGQLLDRALDELDVKRSALYLTNAVKHFKFTEEVTRVGLRRYRKHQPPNAAEANACKPWLVRELEIIKPKRIIALGATAAQSLLGRKVVINEERGTWMRSHLADQLLITAHPASILRTEGDIYRERAYAEFLADLRQGLSQ